ncbi:hypothetical protein PR003_g24496 [Phytophthora rubi]|uniref:Uncharacterized protein n=1 Tax=Phytophthora rubi TaxID=129364 RepID=A0A6A3IFN1_9STRA|nr:hypothetical protein PR002_g23682 [Phytophthora rubi]KAE9293466.1 hypothetical protein PR003_g24496 [Phytophthora rubi]
MASSAYVSWLNKREFKIPRIPANLSSDSEERGCKSPQRRQENAAATAKASATARKRPWATVSKLSALRSLKRRLEGERGDEANDTREKGTGGDKSESSVIKVRTGQNSGHQRQHKHKQKQKPVLLDESCYWLVVQRFSQLR